MRLTPELVEVFARCRHSNDHLARLMFKDAFYSPMTTLHDQIFEVLDNPENRKIVIAAPRGIGKTTIAELLCKRSILYRDKKFIGYMSNSSTSAELISENIKLDLKTNVLVRKFFGDVSQSKVEGIDEKWSQKAWIANGYTFVLPRGAGQQVRGLKWITHRPDLWVIDDLEEQGWPRVL